MPPALYHLATGIHASVYAYQVLRLAHDRSFAEEKIDPTLSPQVAFNQGLERWRALKIVRAGASGKMRDLKPHNVLREVLILQKAHHPNIVQLLDYAWSESIWEHQLALPLLAITIRTLLDSPILSLGIQDELPDLSRLSVSNSRSTLDILFGSISFQLLTALSHLHSLGIAHRDIKPENIMLDWDGTVILIDFGIAWDSDSEDWGGEWKEDGDKMCFEVGTGSYRAPELLFGPMTYDPQAIDLWATGCVLSEFFISTVSHSPQVDPLEEDYMEDTGFGRTSTLFDCTYGDLGLAASIFGRLGSPTPASWPSFESLPDAGKIAFTPRTPLPLSQFLPRLMLLHNSGEIESLISSLLVLEPSRRISAPAAIGSDVFVQKEVLLSPRLIVSEVYVGLGVRFADQIAGSRLLDLFDGVLEPAERGWINRMG